MSVRWRPSGGRGEYEYKVRGADLTDKRVVVRVPRLGALIPTDVRLRIRDGKHRLRREYPNDRTRLNVPPLVAALAALPEPRREHDGARVPFPLTDKGYVIDDVDFAVISSDKETVVVEPLSLRPRDGEYVDIGARLDVLLHRRSESTAVDAFLNSLESASNDARRLTEGAKKVHALVPYVEGSAPYELSLTPKDQIVEEYVGSEGKVKIKLHRQKERDKKLIRLAKARFLATYGKLFCECCGMDFAAMYRNLGDGFIEAHHRTPLASLDGGTPTLLDDLAMLCSNCHRMVHRTKGCSISEVRAAMDASFVNTNNTELLNQPST